MKQILLILSILLLLVSCDNDELPQSDVPFALVGKGDSFLIVKALRKDIWLLKMLKPGIISRKK
ncbi:hypothetical protein [Flavobacterium anhuiense]|uniref:hypothetical protein n=1 Tax=Flavobacterium anhuiense TaxID=459526 RepID=UPI0020260B3F|nr:hypothetical protein [Flavobacterium anhuiense]URM37747.1 hypothetical protein LLY39_04055 [Flavobacterium anhuiense]